MYVSYNTWLADEGSIVVFIFTFTLNNVDAWIKKTYDIRTKYVCQAKNLECVDWDPLTSVKKF